MTDDQTTEVIGTWQGTTVGLAARHTGRRFRLDVDHPGRDRGRRFEGQLVLVGPSEVSGAYGALTFVRDDGGRDTLSLPWGHQLEVLVEPMPAPGLPPGTDVEALVAEALRRFETDRLFHNRAVIAALLAEGTEFGGLDGAVLAGAALALVVVDHPEITP